MQAGPQENKTVTLFISIILDSQEKIGKESKECHLILYLLLLMSEDML